VGIEYGEGLFVHFQGAQCRRAEVLFDIKITRPAAGLFA